MKNFKILFGVMFILGVALIGYCKVKTDYNNRMIKTIEYDIMKNNEDVSIGPNESRVYTGKVDGVYYTVTVIRNEKYITTYDVDWHK